MLQIWRSIFVQSFDGIGMQDVALILLTCPHAVFGGTNLHSKNWRAMSEFSLHPYVPRGQFSL